MTDWLLSHPVNALPVWASLALWLVVVIGHVVIVRCKNKDRTATNAEYARSGVITGFGAGYQDALHKVAASIDSGCDLKEIRRALEQCEIPIRERNDSDLVH